MSTYEGTRGAGRPPGPGLPGGGRGEPDGGGRGEPDGGGALRGGAAVCG